MNRKQFIQLHGATCTNWTWSWSFVNHDKRFVIFGAWDINTKGNTSRILSKEWEISTKGRKQPGYSQALEHIRLMEEDGYQLKTFPMIFSDINRDKHGIGKATIDEFIPELSDKTLKRIGDSWYASDNELTTALPEEVTSPENYVEGATSVVSVITYERNDKARAKCIEHHGYDCAVCALNFETAYGPIGERYIHVHHTIPLSEIGEEYELDPINDLIPVCPNCHAMIHKTQPILTVDELRKELSRRN